MLGLVAVVLAEKHPNFTWQQCTKSGCTDVHGFLVHDKHMGDIRDRDNADYPELDYEKHVGVTVSADGRTVVQHLVSHDWENRKVVGSRIYIVTPDDTKYEEFQFVGKELSYTVDMSEIECGVNAALYTVEMPATGKTPGGVKYGYGYCDANCVDGDCCPEFDIQEASKHAMVFTTHSCQQATSGCDSSGCGYNPYRDDNNHAFWGTTVNVNQPVTVVTQFRADASGNLNEVRRLYVQGGKTIESPKSLTDSFCHYNAGDWHSLSNMGASFKKGHVLVFSLWDSDGMNWMDGGNNGGCTSYNINQLETSNPGLKVTWSNIKFGDLDSTY
uniref:cellulose 1,4-beta-cellobiosidase (non-reducing end) n=2 Tax=Pseudotrichonympha grassii TaxID=104083 RepID=Q95P32_9EUKA|nr:endoglucanase 1 [Pseudotrichonympha grassii]